MNFASQGFNKFVICLGYKGYIIKECFMNLRYHLSDLYFSNLKSEATFVSDLVMDWKIDLIDTGQATLTGGRLKRVKEFTGGETFIMTYGDGLADINISDLISFILSSNNLLIS
jgi:glucose-1-phosphate cytidylyltransferase